MNIYTTPNLLLITKKLFPCLVVIKSYILWQSETLWTSGYCTTSRLQYSLVFLHSEYHTLHFPYMYTYNGLWVSSSLLHTPTNIMQYNSLHGKSRQSHKVFSLLFHLETIFRGQRKNKTSPGYGQRIRLISNKPHCLYHWPLKKYLHKKLMKNYFIAALKSIKFDT